MGDLDHSDQVDDSRCRTPCQFLGAILQSSCSNLEWVGGIESDREIVIKNFYDILNLPGLAIKYGTVEVDSILLNRWKGMSCDGSNWEAIVFPISFDMMRKCRHSYFLIPLIMLTLDNITLSNNYHITWGYTTYSFNFSVRLEISRCRWSDEKVRLLETSMEHLIVEVLIIFGGIKQTYTIESFVRKLWPIFLPRPFLFLQLSIKPVLTQFFEASQQRWSPHSLLTTSC